MAIRMGQGVLAMQRGLVLLPCVLAAFALASCSREGSSAPITDSLTGTVLGPKSYDPKSFVVETRPDEQKFMPVGVTPPARSLRAKSPGELAAEQSGLASQAAAAASSGASITAEGARVKASAPKPPKVE